MAGFDDTNPEPAYLLGRLFALMQQLEETVSRNPQLFFTKFPVAIARPALTLKLRDTYVPPWMRKVAARSDSNAASLGERLTALASRIDPGWNEIDTAAQSLFLVGYHHQMHADRSDEITTDEVAHLLGLGSRESARRELGRLGIEPTGRQPGRDGQNLYPASAVRAAADNRPGRGTRTDLKENAMWTLEFSAATMGEARDLARQAQLPGMFALQPSESGRLGFEVTGPYDAVKALRDVVGEPAYLTKH